MTNGRDKPGSTRDGIVQTNPSRESALLPATLSLIRHLRRQSLLSLRLKEHATRIACHLAQVRGDRFTADVCAFEHAAVMGELRERWAGMIWRVIDTPMRPRRWKVESVRWPGRNNSWTEFFTDRSEASAECDKRNKEAQPE